MNVYYIVTICFIGILFPDGSILRENFGHDLYKLT